MKKLFSIIFILSALVSKAQYPVNNSQGNASTLQYQLGSYGGNIGYVFRAAYSDTTTANLSFVDGVPGQVIRVGDTLFMRNASATRWMALLSGGATYAPGYGLLLSANTFRVDTIQISSRLWRQKGVDSLIAVLVPKTRVLTINGVAQDLSVNRTWGPFLVPADTMWLHDQVAINFTNGLLKTGNDVIALNQDAIWNAQEIQGYPVAATAPTDGQVLVYNFANSRYEPGAASGLGTSNTNIGSGYRILKPAGQELKTLFNGYSVLIDSSTNTNGLTFKVDTANIATKSLVQHRIDSLAAAVGSSYTDAAAKSANPQSKNITIESPTTSENIAIFYTNVAITITKLSDVLRGTSPSVTYQINHEPDRSDGTPNTLLGSSRTSTSTTGATTTTFSDATIPAGSWIWITTSATSGTIAEIAITLTYTID